MKASYSMSDSREAMALARYHSGAAWGASRSTVSNWNPESEPVLISTCPNTHSPSTGTALRVKSGGGDTGNSL
jgi:hypothetical protein